MEEQATLHRRVRVGAGTMWFAGACTVSSLCLLVFNGIGTGVSASALYNTRSSPVAVVPRATDLSTNSQAGLHFYWGDYGVPPRPKAVIAVPSPASSDAPAAADTVPTPPAPAPTPPPASAPTPPPAPSPPQSALPSQGAATAWGCAAALAYLSAYAAPGFTFQCPGGALGHQAMTCVNQPSVCDNEHLIAIADPCPAAYMNEASNSWVLTGASNAPIDPYGACP